MAKKEVWAGACLYARPESLQKGRDKKAPATGVKRDADVLRLENDLSERLAAGPAGRGTWLLTCVMAPLYDRQSRGAIAYLALAGEIIRAEGSTAA